MIRPADAVIDFLEAEQARGVSHVYLDEGARAGLRALLRRAKEEAGTKEAPNPEAAAPPPAEPATVAAELTVTGGSKAERLASLRQQVVTWEPLRALGTLRDTIVFATGNPDARIMFVGAAPGYEEEKKGEPFVGPAGQKLDDILKAMGLCREEVYLSLIVKFRPATARQATNNRQPSAQEMAACLPFIHAEVDIVRPACIIALGSTAAEGLLGLTSTIEAMRGSWHAFDGIPVRVTYHPGHLLKSTADLAIRRQVWEDMLMVMEEVILPISAKQRGFFLAKS